MLTGSWSITSWLSVNLTYITILLMAILIPLILMLDKIGTEPTVPAKPIKAPTKQEAKKDK